MASGRPISYAELLSKLFDRYGQAHGKALVGTKNAYSIATLHSLWPQAKFVNIIRDGRDVALSANSWSKLPKLKERFATWREDPVSTAALWWEWQARVGREAGSSLNPDVYYEVRYESLVAQPAQTLAGICAFLGVPFDEAMLRFNEGREKEDGNLSPKHAWKPPTPGLRDWRSQMTPEDVEKFEAVAGDLLEALGYPRGAKYLSRERLESAAKLRSVFEGRPLPQRWQVAAAA